MNPDIPLYEQIARSIEARIISGELPVGANLESEATMMAQFEVSRATVRQALARLETKGLIHRSRGVPTTVARRTIVRPTEFHSLFEDLVGPGVEIDTKVLVFEYIPCSREIRRLCREFSVGEPLAHFRRLCLVNSTPIAVFETWMRESLVTFTKPDLEKRSLYQLITESGVQMVRAHQELGARRCTAEEAELLDSEEGAPVLTMTRSSYDENDELVDFGIHVHHADRHVFTQDLVRRHPQ
ncbi:GntR family transcriptional regulator [Gulosibacter sp. 10]|uniref:GntR family transcriptional regulator n=1 Tax=Gulosibacter sp. 10 TaxID=1255570 RepID=UPI00097E9E7C|nr:GntR family transcriptional regulator [Gulosibacter sp. 10]SJM64006.1 Transcriptional regulator, GntR family [Gulosibacter sp. 10]